MNLKCSGSGDSTIEYYDCPKCGEEVETFSDDPKVTCHNCGHTVFKESNPTCVAWCEHAVQCVGEQRYNEIMGALEEQGKLDAEGNLVEEEEEDQEDEAPDELDLDLM